MAPLFTVDELAVYVQSDLKRSTAELITSLTLDAIAAVVGARMTDPPQPGIKGIGLEAAKRALLNPSNVQSESANGTSITYNTGGTSRGVDLTDREVARLREIVGDTGAYTVDLLDEGLGQRVWWPPDAGWPP